MKNYKYNNLSKNKINIKKIIKNRKIFMFYQKRIKILELLLSNPFRMVKQIFQEKHDFCE